MEALRDLRWVILMLIGLFVAWLIFGSRGGITGPFIRPPAPLGSGETYGGSSIRQGENSSDSNNIDGSENGNTDLNIDIKDLKNSFKKLQGLANSKYEGLVTISSSAGAKQTSPDKERIDIRVKSGITEKIPVTDWRLESAVTGKSVSLGEGVYLPYSSRVNPESYIYLESGDRAVIVSGRSPIGISFRLNQCTGYFEQFQDFNPSLPKKCPDPVDDLPNFGVGGLTNTCFDFVDRIPKCEVYLDALPGNLGGACLNHINQKINYNTCVDIHKDSKDFYSNEWRIYLERDQELWGKRREIIKLIDHEGEIVDVISY